MRKCRYYFRGITLICLLALAMTAMVFYFTGCNNHQTDLAEENRPGESYEVDSTENYEPGNNERYLSIGFDDFRASDFTMVIPIFNEYGAHATFNRIAYETEFTEDENWKMNVVLETGNELGDHTWHHCNFIFNDPLFNGQDPSHPEGNQEPFPSNEQMRGDYGEGKNAFGFSLDESCKAQLSDWNNYDYVWTAFDAKWRDLTDEQCQYIREYYSIMCNSFGLLEVLDNLSNTYLGTTGSSKGSWSDEKQCYTGGIFTGAKTSQNHEIWERILLVTGDFYEEKYGIRPVTWSWPGSIPSPFIFEKDGKYYYDKECSILYNYLAPMPSSIYANEDGTVKMRSWTDALRENGYKIAHDTFFPSRADGTELTMMSKQLIFNASLSRKDALTYRTNSSFQYNEIADIYNEDFFDSTSNKSRAAQMYDDGGVFYKFIESIRQNTSNGMVHGEVIDSVDSASESTFFREMLEYCRQTGVNVISKKDAYSVCFDKVLETGNLIYNSDFRNTAEEFMPDAERVPTNPDGYTGQCWVEKEESGKALVTDGITQYLHYGIPLGDILYSASMKGEGTVSFYAIKNNDSVELDNKELDLLGELEISSDSYSQYDMTLYIPDNPETEFEQICNGMGEKIMGLKIEYSSGLHIKNICLMKQ